MYTVHAEKNIVTYLIKWFSRTWRAQPLPYIFVKKRRKNICFHQEFFSAFASLFFTRLRGDRGDLYSRATDHLCHLPVCAGRVPSLPRTLTTSSQLLSTLTARFTCERSGSPITTSCATISLPQCAVRETTGCGTVASSHRSHCSANQSTDGTLRRVRHSQCMRASDTNAQSRR